MTRRRWTEDQLIEAVAQNTTVAGVVRQLRLIAAGGNYRSVNRVIAQLGLDTSHFKGQGWSRGLRLDQGPRRPLADVLTADSPYLSNTLKRRLLKAGLKSPNCEGCGRSTWNGLPIPLELDHVNGVHDDNRLENLRLLCPNCHAQTPTYRGRNIGKSRRLSQGVPGVGIEPTRPFRDKPF